ncbi:MAG TPA: cation diffusion facilitator family transporter, partial [Woeseiaceae bacterium]
MTDDSRDNRKRLKIALLLTAIFMVVEVVGGIVSGSLALLADAGHMLADSLALALALLAFRLSLRPADAKRSYGYHRFQTLAAFVNGLALIVVVVWILVEAAGRLMAPPQVLGGMMMAVAGAGLLVNVVVFLILHGGDRHNLNMQGALLHVIGDLLGSIAALSAAIVIVLTGWMPIDPLLSIVVAGLILRSAWQLVGRSAHILLEGTPETFDVERMQQSLITAVPQIDSIHHVHVWGLTPQRLMLTMHVSLRGEFRDSTAV